LISRAYIGSMNRSLAEGNVLKSFLFTMRSPDAVVFCLGVYEQIIAHAI